MAKKTLAKDQSERVSKGIPEVSDLEPTASEDAWLDEVVEVNRDGKVYKAAIRDRLVLRELSASEVKDGLNEIPGRIAYWNKMLSDVVMRLEAAAEEYTTWFAQKYDEAVDKFDKKPTETAIKNRVLLDNINRYRELRGTVLDFQNQKMQLDGVIKAYETQGFTLGHIADIIVREMGNIEPKVHGKASLKDI